MSKIPDTSRTTVRLRAHQLCERCRCPSPSAHWHHRRSRSVVDVHQHCPCNGVNLCYTCHTWVHAHPVEAQRGGWIVSRHTTDPGTIPVETPWGARLHRCDGSYLFI